MLKKQKQNYNLTSTEIFHKFETGAQGLSETAAQQKLKEIGANKLRKKHSWKWLKLIGNQFNDALVWILLVAAGLALVFGEQRDAIIIFIIIFINATVGFFQEFKAERILESINKLTTDKALVLRDGEKKELAADKIVPGDVIFVTAGDNIPADGYLIEGYDFKVNSFIFTGESRPEIKKSQVLVEQNLALADIDNMVFSGETVATGEAYFVVTGTGMQTELGKLAHMTAAVEDDPTPLQKQMRTLGRDVTILSIFIGVVVIIAGQYFRMSLYQNFLFALALSVSVVPEGLPAAISVALSLGMKRLLKHNVLAKKLNAVETLGSVGIICTDKTGTITQNELTVTKVTVGEQSLEVTGIGYETAGEFFCQGQKVNPAEITNLELLLRIGALCNSSSLIKEDGKYKILGDPTEGALLVVGRKFDGRKNFFLAGEKKLAENPFSSERMRMSVVFKNDETVSFVKGSPDILLELCTRQRVGNQVIELTPEARQQIRQNFNALSAEALRVLGFAYRNLDALAAKYAGDREGFARAMAAEAEKDLIWVGTMAMIDPPRKNVSEAIAECKKLGIKVIMITGDYEITAEAIAKNIGLIDGKNSYEVLSGKQLNLLKDREIFRKIKEKEIVFARIAPEQKLRIATILKNNKQIIAMTGDGVNDAPALKKADIGVAMGFIGTDVSKEASDMILLDDNFVSIVRGVREGRTIFKNLRKFVHYVFTSNASELLTIIFGVILQIPAPISAIQILAVDLGTDIFPSFSLGLEPQEPDSKKKSALGGQEIINRHGFKRIIYLGVIMATGAVVAFLLSMFRGGWKFGIPIDSDSVLYIKSTTAAYAVLAMTQMANLLQSRSETLSPFELGFFKNKYAIGAIFISVGIFLSFMYVPLLQQYLRMLPIDWKDWLVVIVSIIVVFFFEEARKAELK